MTVTRKRIGNEMKVDVDGRQTTIDEDMLEIDEETKEEIRREEDVVIQKRYEARLNLSAVAHVHLWHHNKHVRKDMIYEQGCHVEPYDWEVIQIGEVTPTGRERLYDCDAGEHVTFIEYLLRRDDLTDLPLDPWMATILADEGQTSLDRWRADGESDD